MNISDTGKVHNENVANSMEKPTKAERMASARKFAKISVLANSLSAISSLSLWMLGEGNLYILVFLIGVGLVLFALLLLKRFTVSAASAETFIKKAPASTLLKAAELLPKKWRRSLELEISDMRLEYYEALSAKNVWRAKFIAAFYYVGLGWSVAMWISDKIKEVAGIIPKQN